MHININITRLNRCHVKVLYNIKYYKGTCISLNIMFINVNTKGELVSSNG